MNTKLQKIKTKCPKNKTFAEKVAEVCGCSDRYVNKVLNGEVDITKRNTKLVEDIQVAATLLRAKDNEIIQEVKALVQINP